MWILDKWKTKIINTDVVHKIYIKYDTIYDFKNERIRYSVGLYADDDLIEVFENNYEAQKRLNYFVCELNLKEVKE